MLCISQTLILRIHSMRLIVRETIFNDDTSEMTSKELVNTHSMRSSTGTF